MNTSTITSLRQRFLLLQLLQEQLTHAIELQNQLAAETARMLESYPNDANSLYKGFNVTLLKYTER